MSRESAIAADARELIDELMAMMERDLDISEFNPIRDRIIMKPVEQEQDRQTEGGLYIPETAEEENKSRLNLVLAVGPKVRDERLKPGALVIASKAAFPFRWRGEYVRVVKEGNIIALWDASAEEYYD